MPLNLSDYVVLIILAVAVVVAVISIIKGKGRCSRNCDGCQFSDNCGKKKDTE
ncbi:MAG: FeoB-associated Cys-rich membrane protein [Oscillospiraceae bacterium]